MKIPQQIIRSLAIATVTLISACGVDKEPPFETVPCATCTGMVINEAVSSNSQFDDEDGDAEDWIELYNNSDVAVSLAGWSLTDDPLEPNKWVFPSMQLGAQQHLLVWASKKNRAIVAKPLHTNFKISSDGEVVYLFDASATLKHSMEIRGLRTGTSVGLSSINQAMVYYDQPTPGAKNSENEYAGVINTEISYSHSGGTTSPAMVMLSGAEGDQTIRYTMDGTVPTAQSPLYQGALPTSGNAVIRSRIFAQHFIPSTTQSRTFLPDASHDIAVVTLATDPLNFFDNSMGIYVLGASAERQAPNYGANFWQDWERDIHFSFYEPNGSLGIQFDTGVKIFGGYTRSFAQKSMAFYARGRYGADKFEYPFFSDLPYKKFENLILRTSGNDWLRTMIRDRVFTTLMEGSGVDVQAGRPVAVYLNGEYWGLHNLREKVNEHFLGSKHDIDKDELDLLEGDAEVVEGSNEEYIALIDYLTTADPTQENFYTTVSEKIDLENFISYQALQIFIANTDWPGRNVKFWKTPETKWQWILYDTDFGFSLYQDNVRNNTLAYATAEDSLVVDNPPWSTFLLRTLLKNSEFKNQFISHFSDQLNSRFMPDNIKSVVDRLADPIRTEIPQQAERWVTGRNNWNWERDVSQLITFANERPNYMWQHLRTQFNLSSENVLSITDLDTNAGSVRVNSVAVEESSWSGKYFAEVPVRVTAIAQPGYEFSHWVDDNDSSLKEQTLNLTLEQAMTITPVFLKAVQSRG